MKAVLYLSATVLVALCATWAYQVNYATRDAASRVAALQSQIAHQRETLAVLRAEWAYLKRPDRLSALAALYQDDLGLVPLTPEQFGEVAMVAFPPVLLPVAGDIE
jgi:hypothetical protein